MKNYDLDFPTFSYRPVAAVTIASWQPLPRHVQPMLATVGSLPSGNADAQWGFEMKWDGVRAMVRVHDGTVTLTSRNSIDMSASYPELVELGTAEAGRELFLDGEIVTFDPAGRPSFSRLQKRMHVADRSSASRLAKSDPVMLLVFDVLHLNGNSLLHVPYVQRRELLEELGLAGQSWHTPAAFTGKGHEAVAVSQLQGLEGVIAKRLDSRYFPGRRSPDWLKIKNVRMQEVVIGGWKAGNGSRSGTIGSLLLGVPGRDGLHYAGKVGTGFTEIMLCDLVARLEALASPANPFAEVPRLDARDAHWVQPQLVGEVAFTEWTADNRLRHPAWRGLRPDKSPDQVTRES